MRRRMLLVAVILVFGVASTASATFPGDNGALVFEGMHLESGTTQVYRMNADGGGLTLLTTPIDGIDNEAPSWSADAQRIYFDRFVEGSGSQIWRMDASGGSQTLVADPHFTPSYVGPQVNRSGTKIVAGVYEADGTEGIATMDADGSDQQILATAGANQDLGLGGFAPYGSLILFYELTWAPNGGGIASSDLLILYPSGHTRNITDNNDGIFTDPSWSPRGTSILAVRGADEDEIVVMSRTGRNVRSLLKVPGATLSPTFSPDGSKIAFQQCIGDCGDPDLQGTGSIWVMDADGSNLRQILDQASTGVQASGNVDWGVSAP